MLKQQQLYSSTIYNIGHFSLLATNLSIRDLPVNLKFLKAPTKLLYYYTNQLPGEIYEKSVPQIQEGSVNHTFCYMIRSKVSCQIFF